MPSGIHRLYSFATSSEELQPLAVIPYPTMDKAIEVFDLCKRFGSVQAVDHLSFTVESGRTCALLGGNGAGKTTTLSMLLGLLLPTSGNIRILGVNMIKHRYQVLPRMSFTSPYVDLPQRLTVAQNLYVYARLYGVSNPEKRIGQLAEELDLELLIDRPYKSLSSGQRTRVSLAKSLLNSPQVVLMDEPTASLDPTSADYIRGYLMEFQKRTGATMLLASHNMQEVERMCDDVLMLKQGRIVDHASPDVLLHQYGRNTLEQVFLDMDREHAN